MARFVIEAPDDLEAWERQPGEGPKMFHAFCHYRDLGAIRSVDKAWRQHKQLCEHAQPTGNKRADRAWHFWGTNWGWVERSAMWDREQDRAARAKILKDQVDARARHARMAQAFQQVLTVPVKAVLDAIQQNPQVMVQLVQDAQNGSKGLIKLIDLASWASKSAPGLVAVERLALGLTTDLVEIEDKREDDIGIRIASDPEATELAIALLNKVAGTPQEPKE